MNALQIGQVLNRVAPAMAGGFVIQCSYGDLDIAPGPLAEAMRDLVAQFAARELARLEQLEADAPRDEMGFPVSDARVIGAGWVPALPGVPAAHRPAESPCHVGNSARSAAPESQPPCALAQPGATPQTRGGRQ